ncbi:MAG: hypothetical protein CM15mP77_1160 [Synechococcus sp.]|nr:MAG: hypothetical protein CM15mP77_1160 [Synechococcus sp.]
MTNGLAGTSVPRSQPSTGQARRRSEVVAPAGHEVRLKVYDDERFLLQIDSHSELSNIGMSCCYKHGVIAMTAF